LSKKKYKKKAREQKNEQELSEKADLVYSKKPINYFRYIIALPILLAVAAGVYFIFSAYKTNGYFGFPLDDPWIHLTFAKNLIEYGSFSYFKNELVTSGSTSPVYTLLLSLLYIFIKNEFIISYLLGVFFGALLVYMMTKLSLLQFKNFELLALLTSVLIALQPKLNLINVSGMETSLFIFLIAASLFEYQNKRMVLLGIFLGLTIWCRPDGFVLWIAIALDYFFKKMYLGKNRKVSSEKSKSHKEIITAFSIALIFVASYFIFNYLLSGSILPNTYKAKLEYYQHNNRTLFLEEEILKYFTEAEFIVIWISFLIYFLVIIRSIIKRESNPYLVYLLFIFGLIAVYYIKLPFTHRFGRYLMPVIPFYILIAIGGVKTIIDFIQRKTFKRIGSLANFIFIAYSIGAVAMFLYQNTKITDDFIAYCKYHNDRHVAAGKWIKKNTNETDVVAAHDVGAIAFYGERKIIDMAGLITPELIPHLNDQLYSDYMNDYLTKHKVDYIVTLRNWIEVVNDKPVYSPVNEFEFLEIFKYDPKRTHIQPREVSQRNQAAIQMLQNGAASDALANLHQSLSLDNKSSMTQFLLGAVYETLKDYPKAEKYFNTAIELYPEFAEAYFGLAKINFELNKQEKAYHFVTKCLELNPDYAPGVQLKSRLDGLLNKK
jgi:tetratricopeptide (TPR) repeat protein